MERGRAIRPGTGDAVTCYECNREVPMGEPTFERADGEYECESCMELARDRTYERMMLDNVDRPSAAELKERAWQAHEQMHG